MSVYDQKITYRGKTQTVTEWASDLGITPNALYKRINVLFWDLEKALSVQNKHSRTYYGRTLNQWVKTTGIDRHILWHRFNSGTEDPEKLLGQPVKRQHTRPYPPLIYGYHRERLRNRVEGCCYPDCFHCPLPDCEM